LTLEAPISDNKKIIIPVILAKKFSALVYQPTSPCTGTPPARSRCPACYACGMSEALDTQLATKGDILRLDGRINLIQWMIAFNLAFTMAMLWKVFS